MDIFDETTVEEIVMVDKGTEDLDVFDYAKQIIACKIEMKSIQDDIQVIKTSARENGVLVKEIDSTMADIVRDLKEDPSESLIKAELRAKFEANKDVMASMSQLI